MRSFMIILMRLSLNLCVCLFFICVSYITTCWLIDPFNHVFSFAIVFVFTLSFWIQNLSLILDPEIRLRTTFASPGSPRAFQPESKGQSLSGGSTERHTKWEENKQAPASGKRTWGKKMSLIPHVRFSDDHCNLVDLVVCSMALYTCLSCGSETFSTWLHPRFYIL